MVKSEQIARVLVGYNHCKEDRKNYDWRGIEPVPSCKTYKGIKEENCWGGQDPAEEYGLPVAVGEVDFH